MMIIKSNLTLLLNIFVMLIVKMLCLCLQRKAISGDFAIKSAKTPNLKTQSSFLL